MKKILILALAAVLLVPILNARGGGKEQNGGKRYNMYGVMFYNLENLFDTINTNGTYDLEFSPKGARQWNGQKYWSKQHNLAYAISQMTTKGTPMGPVIIGVSEVENITVLQDLVRQPEIKDWHLQIVHHNSPDRRGIDVGLLYNPRYFRVLNVTNQNISKYLPTYPTFRTRDQLCVTGLLAGEKVTVMVNHWPSRLGGQEQSSWLREAAAQMCRHTIDSLLADDPNQGIIFMGDLNDDPMDKSCAQVLGGKRNINDVKTYSDIYNPFWEKLAKGIGTLAYRGSWNLFDQIVCNGYFTRYFNSASKPQLTFLRADVLNKEFLKTKEGSRQGYPLRTYSGGVWLNGYSDHFPTQIYLVKEAQ